MFSLFFTQTLKPKVFFAFYMNTSISILRFYEHLSLRVLFVFTQTLKPRVFFIVSKHLSQKYYLVLHEHLRPLHTKSEICTCGFPFFSILHPFLLKWMLQMQNRRKSNLIRMFCDGRKFRRQCVNVIFTTWGRIYFSTCENFGHLSPNNYFIFTWTLNGKVSFGFYEHLS